MRPTWCIEVSSSPAKAHRETSSRNKKKKKWPNERKRTSRCHGGHNGEGGHYLPATLEDPNTRQPNFSSRHTFLASHTHSLAQTLSGLCPNFYRTHCYSHSHILPLSATAPRWSRIGLLQLQVAGSSQLPKKSPETGPPYTQLASCAQSCPACALFSSVFSLCSMWTLSALTRPAITGKRR